MTSVFEFGSDSTREYGLVLCKDHKKRFEWLGKNVYEKIKGTDPRIFMLLLQMERTEDTCMWCEQPDKFEPYIGSFDWMLCEDERRKARCDHQWEHDISYLEVTYSRYGRLPDGRVVREEKCPKCLTFRYHSLPSDDAFSILAKKILSEKIVSQDDAHCANCARYDVTSSYCPETRTLRLACSTCSYFKKGQNINGYNLVFVE
jgi:hypothetical protein